MILQNSTVQTDFGGDVYVANLKEGGYNGLYPKTSVVGADGKSYSLLVANQPYVKRPLIPIMLDYPMGFDYLPNKDDLVATYKALIELHTQTIDGLNNTLAVETGSTPIGGAGEQWITPTNVTREQSSFNATYQEKVNKAIFKFHEWFIRMFIMDPDTKVPEITKLSSYDNEGPYTAEMWTFSVLLIEPDLSGKYVVDAWIGENLFPQGSGESTGSKDRTAAGETVNLSINYGGHYMSNASTRQLAQEILNKIQTSQKAMDEMPIFMNEISPDVASVSGGIIE
jgi:hypothetical protein